MEAPSAAEEWGHRRAVAAASRCFSDSRHWYPRTALTHRPRTAVPAQQREVSAAEYYAQFYAPFLSEDAQRTMAPALDNLNGDAPGFVARGARGTPGSYTALA